MLTSLFGNLDWRHWVLSHLVWIVCVAVALILGHSYIAEHDARLLAEQQIKQSEQQVEDLQKTIAANDAAAAQQLSKLRVLQTKVTTPQQAIAAIPTLSDVPLNTRMGPTAGTAVVDVVPLFQE